MTSVWVLLECLLRNSVCPWNLVQGSTPCQLYELVHNPHTPTHIHIPLHSPHIHSVTSYRLSVGSWATLGQVVPLLSESMMLEIVLYGWMASSVLGMRVLWHCAILVDWRIITVHMWMTQGLYVQVEVDLHDWFDQLLIVLVMAITCEPNCTYTSTFMPIHS